MAFSSLVRTLGEGSMIPHLGFYFFEVEISLCIPAALFLPGSVHSGSASCDDCGGAFPDELRVGIVVLVQLQNNPFVLCQSLCVKWLFFILVLS